MSVDQLEHVHKVRAEQLRAALAAQGVTIRHGHALEGIAATHGHTWAALAEHPDLPALDAASARIRLIARLRALGTVVTTDQVPDHLLIPYIAPEQALRAILPPGWAQLVPSSVSRVQFDLHRTMKIESVNGGQVITRGPRPITKEDVLHLLSRVGRRWEDRAGFTHSSLVVRAGFDGPEVRPPGWVPENISITANHDYPGIAQALGQALNGNLIIVGPSYDYLGPRLRDVARHLLRRSGTRVHTLEWSGSLTGAGAQPLHDLRGVQRTVADDGVGALTAIQPEPGRRTAAVIEFPIEFREEPNVRHARAIRALVERGVQVVVGVYARDLATLPLMDGGSILSDRRLFPVQVATDQLPGYTP